MTKPLSVVDHLARLLDDKASLTLLKSRHVTPKQYALWVFDTQRRKTDRTGYAIGAVLILMLGGLSGVAGWENGSTWQGAIFAGLAGGLLGLAITWGTMRHLHGKRSVYVSHPGDTTPGFSLLGMVHALRSDSIKQLGNEDWERIQQHQPLYPDRVYQFIPGEDTARNKRKQLRKLSERQERLVETLSGIQTGAAWLVPISLLTLVLDHFSFAWPSLFFAGTWFFLEGLIGFIKRSVGGFTGAGEVELHGWPAQLSAIVIMLTACLLGILPGLLGTAQELGFDILDLLFG